MSSRCQTRWASLCAVAMLILAVVSLACRDSGDEAQPIVPLATIPTGFPEPPAATTGATPTVNGAGGVQPMQAANGPAPSPAAVFCDAWEASFDASLEGDATASSFDAFNHTPAGKAFLAAYNKAAYGKHASDDEACEAAYAVARRVGGMP